jgi:hypothetical protein
MTDKNKKWKNGETFALWCWITEDKKRLEQILADIRELGQDENLEQYLRLEVRNDILDLSDYEINVQGRLIELSLDRVDYEELLQELGKQYKVSI